MDISYASTISSRCFLFAIVYTLLFCKKSVVHGLMDYVRVFNLVPFVHMSVFMPTPSCFYYYRAIVELEVGDGDTSRKKFQMAEIHLKSVQHP